jgi:hypothetical protein
MAGTVFEPGITLTNRNRNAMIPHVEMLRDADIA